MLRIGSATRRALGLHLLAESLGFRHEPLDMPGTVVEIDHHAVRYTEQHASHASKLKIGCEELGLRAQRPRPQDREARNRDCREHPEDQHHRQQLDQREAVRAAVPHPRVVSVSSVQLPTSASLSAPPGAPSAPYDQMSKL